MVPVYAVFSSCMRTAPPSPASRSRPTLSKLYFLIWMPMHRLSGRVRWNDRRGSAGIVEYQKDKILSAGPSDENGLIDIVGRGASKKYQLKWWDVPQRKRHLSKPYTFKNPDDTRGEVHKRPPPFWICTPTSGVFSCSPHRKKRHFRL